MNSHQQLAALLSNITMGTLQQLPKRVASAQRADAVAVVRKDFAIESSCGSVSLSPGQTAREACAAVLATGLMATRCDVSNPERPIHIACAPIERSDGAVVGMLLVLRRHDFSETELDLLRLIGLELAATVASGEWARTG